MSVEQVKDLLAQAQNNPEAMQQLATNPQAMAAIAQNAPQIAMSWLSGFKPTNPIEWLTLPIRLASYVDGFMRTEHTNFISGFGAKLLRLIGVDRAADWIIDKHTDLIADKAGIIADRAFGFVKEQIGSPELQQMGGLNFKLDRDKVRSLLIAGGWVSGVNDMAETISNRIVGAIDMTPVGGLMNNEIRGNIKQNIGGIFSNKALASTLIFGLVAANAFQKEIESAFPVAKNIFKIAKPVFNALPGGIEDQLKNLQKGISAGEFADICQTYFVAGDRLKSAAEVAGSLKQFNIVETTKLAIAIEKLHENEGYIEIGDSAVKFPREVESLVNTLARFSSSLHTGPQISDKSKANPKILQAKLKDYVEEMIETSNRLASTNPALAPALPRIIENSIGIGDDIKAAIIQGLNEPRISTQRTAADAPESEITESQQPNKSPQEAIKDAGPDEFLALLRGFAGGSVSAAILQHKTIRSAENPESKFLLDVITLLDTAADNPNPVDRAKQQVAVLSQALKGGGEAVLTPGRVGIMFNMLNGRLDQRVADIPKAMALGGTFAEAVESVQNSFENKQHKMLELHALDPSMMTRQ